VFSEESAPKLHNEEQQEPVVCQRVARFPELWVSKLWSWVLRYSQPRMTVAGEPAATYQTVSRRSEPLISSYLCEGAATVSAWPQKHLIKAPLQRWNGWFYQAAYVSLTRNTNWTGWSRRNALDLYSGGPQFKFQPEHWLYWLRFSCFFSVYQRKRWYNASISPWLLPPKSFPFYLSSHHPTPYSLSTECVIKYPTKINKANTSIIWKSGQVFVWECLVLCYEQAVKATINVFSLPSNLLKITLYR
jgi:hypothetical protein